jgi:hypothetical protein
MATVYFIQAGRGGPIKIGKSRGDPRVRMRTLQTAHHEQLGLVGTITLSDPVDASLLEAELHRTFYRHRIRGEWFALADDLLSYMMFNCDARTIITPNYDDDSYAQ